MLPSPSARVARVEPAATLMITVKTRALVQQGFDVINLGGGETDFGATPPHIGDATKKAIEEGQTRYTESRGLSKLREAIASKLMEENELDFDPETEIIVTPGVKMAVFAAIASTIDLGDEALILDPSWVSYEPSVRLAGGVPVRVSLSKDEYFRVNGAKLREKLTPNSRLLIVNSPNNPTGRVYRREELEAIADVASENNLFILSDEVYEAFLYDAHRHVSVGSLPDMAARTITVNGFSKVYAMTGFRLGYLGAKESLTSEILKVQQHIANCATSFSQYGGIGALAGPQGFVRQMVEAFHERRDILTDGLNSLAGVSCHRPEGTYYCFPDISKTNMSSMEFADMLLDRARVAVVPGIAFGDSGEGHVRMAFDNSAPRIQEALERMSDVL